MDDRILWYATRGAGAVSLILLSAVVVLGLNARRGEPTRRPRFLTPALHNDLALMTLVFLALHIVTALVAAGLLRSALRVFGTEFERHVGGVRCSMTTSAGVAA